jgi:hypothetical protein
MRTLVPFKPPGRFERLCVRAPHANRAIECSIRDHDHSPLRDAHTLGKVTSSCAQGLAERYHVFLRSLSQSVRTGCVAFESDTYQSRDFFDWCVETENFIHHSVQVGKLIREVVI